MRLKDERLNPGWESRGYADVEILNPFWATNIFFFLLHINTTATQIALSIFFFFSSYRNDLSGTALDERREGRDKNYVTVIVLLRKSASFTANLSVKLSDIISTKCARTHAA